MSEHRRVHVVNGVRVDIDTDAIYLVDDATDKEIVMWSDAEWIEDPSLVQTIVNAVLVGVTEGADALWARLPAEAAELASNRAWAASDADPSNEELYQAAEKAHADSFWANQALPVSMRYPENRFDPKDGR